ncbi:MAG: hypothetical protein ABI624_10085 [Casimicrobiaceae bacterium]
MPPMLQHGLMAAHVISGAHPARQCESPLLFAMAAAVQLRIFIERKDA